MSLRVSRRYLAELMRMDFCIVYPVPRANLVQTLIQFPSPRPAALFT